MVARIEAVAKPPRRTQAQRRDEARDRVLQAAAELIAERGLVGVTLAEAGERAGYSRGIGTHHFGTRATLLVALIDRVEEEFAAAVAPLHVPEASVDELVEMTAVFVDMLMDLPVLHRAFLVLWATAVADDELRPRMAQSDEAFRTAVASIIERGKSGGDVSNDVDESAFAVMLLGQLRGVALQYLIDPAAVDLLRAKSSLETMVWAVLRA